LANASRLSEMVHIRLPSLKARAQQKVALSKKIWSICCGFSEHDCKVLFIQELSCSTFFCIISGIISSALNFVDNLVGSIKKCLDLIRVFLKML